MGYPELKGRLPTRYSPVRQFTRSRRNFLLRLACVKHAASVRPEPGSNSPLYVIKIFVVLAGIDVRLVAYQIFNNHAVKSLKNYRLVFIIAIFIL